MIRPNKIKILLLLPSLVPGGAERVISFVAQNLNKDKFDVILLIAGFEKDTGYDVSNINVIYLNKLRILTALPSIIYTIFKFKPHIVLSSISHVNKAMSIIAPFFGHTKFIGREATILSMRKNEHQTRRWSLVHNLPFGYNNLDALICQSQDMAYDMVSNYKISKEKIRIINNPISNLQPLKRLKTKSTIKKFITVGKLKEVKGYFRIIEILSKLKIPFQYTIVGEGPLKDEIFDKAKSLNIYDYIKYIPFTNKVSDVIAEHDMFLQGSYVEGFPNALLESCVVGTPVIAFNAPGGTKEIVVNGVNGFLVENEISFLKKLEEDNSWDPIEIRNSVLKKYNKEKIISEYEQLFMDILKF